MHSIEQFVELEREVWSALVNGDIETDTRLLTDSFLGVYSTGFAGKEEHLEQLKWGPVISEYEIIEPRFQVLAEGVVLLAYLATYRPIKMEKGLARKSMYVTSIWLEDNGVWRNSFSQDTPTMVSCDTK